MSPEEHSLRDWLTFAKELQATAKAEYDKASHRVIGIEANLAKICSHPEEDLDRRRTFIEGNYYDRSYTVHTVRCKACGTKLHEEHDTRGSHYG